MQSMQQILCEVVAADTSSLFLLPLPSDKLINYKRVVKRPMSLTSMAAYLAATAVPINNSVPLVGLENGDHQQKKHSPIPYQWQAFEDDLVTMLLNCIAYNKVGSAYYKAAVGFLKDLPRIFAKHGATYTRVYQTNTSIGASASGVSHQRGGRAKSSAASFTTAQSAPAAAFNIVGGKNPTSTEQIHQQLEHEALMLHFTALFADDLAGALTSILLTAPLKASVVQHPYSHETANPLATVSDETSPRAANGFIATASDATKPLANNTDNKAFVFSNYGLNHLIPTSVEALRQRVMTHAFPNLGSFLRTVSMMLGLAIACTTDEEAVDILVAFQQKVEQQCTVWPAALMEAEASVAVNRAAAAASVVREAKKDGAATTTPTSLAATIARTAAALRPIGCEPIIAEAAKDANVQRAVDTVLLGKTVAESPAAASVAAPSPTSSYKASTINQQDELLRAAALALIASLASADTTASFHTPFLLSDYVALIHQPCDFYTMRLKAVLGMYTVPFVSHLPDTRPTHAASSSSSCLATTEKKTGEASDNANAEVKHGEDSDEPTIIVVKTDETAAEAPSQPAEIDYTILDAVRAAIRADVDRMVDNCTYFNGPDHQLSRLVTEIRRSFAGEARKCGL